jgi:hypothetical protein
MITRAGQIIVFFLLLSSSIGAFAQEDSVQNLYFVRKGKPVSFFPSNYLIYRSAFYIYRNCVYDVYLKDQRHLQMRIFDIRNDSLVYTLDPGSKSPATIPSDADSSNQPEHSRDTFRLSPSEWRLIRIVRRDIGWGYSILDLGKYNYVFEKSVKPRAFDYRRETRWSPDSSHYLTYEVVPRFEGFTVGLASEHQSIHYFNTPPPVTPKEDQSKRKKPRKKNGGWFLPSNVDTINGLSIGLLSATFTGRSLTIRGVNVNVDLLSAFATLYGLFEIPLDNRVIDLPDSDQENDRRYHLSGVSLSAGGLIPGWRVKGVCLNGGICIISAASGLLVTGTQNQTGEFNGVEISGLRNKSIKGRGMQVAIINVCRDFKGVQLGLWNVNSKRRLPLINWNF